MTAAGIQFCACWPSHPSSILLTSSTSTGMFALAPALTAPPRARAPPRLASAHTARVESTRTCADDPVDLCVPPSSSPVVVMVPLVGRRGRSVGSVRVRCVPTPLPGRPHSHGAAPTRTEQRRTRQTRRRDTLAVLTHDTSRAGRWKSRRVGVTTTGSLAVSTWGEGEARGRC